MRELRGRGEQAEDDEHADLRKPGHAVLEAAEEQRLPEPPVPRDQPGDIDGEEAAAMEHAGDAEEHERGGEHDDRVETGFKVEPVDQPDDGEAAAEAEQEAEPHLAQEGEREGERHALLRRRPWR